MVKYISKLYKDYKAKCKNAKRKHISKDEFNKVVEAAQKNISIIKNQYKNPMCAIELDDVFIYYVEVRDSKAVINIWTKDQYQILTGNQGVESGHKK